MNNKLYHITRRDNVGSILREGLLTESEHLTSLEDDDRIYLTSDWIDVLYNDAEFWSYDLSLLEVDVTGLELVVDPEYDQVDEEWVWYCISNIDPDRIRYLGDLEVTREYGTSRLYKLVRS